MSDPNTMEHNPNPISHDNGAIDLRYRISPEYCGHEKPRYVARFCDEFIASSAFYSSALMLAIGHNARRKGALVIVEIPEHK
jgi:hypothetical protein